MLCFPCCFKIIRRPKSILHFFNAFTFTRTASWMRQGVGRRSIRPSSRLGSRCNTRFFCAKTDRTTDSALRSGSDSTWIFRQEVAMSARRLALVELLRPSSSLRRQPGQLSGQGRSKLASSSRGHLAGRLSNRRCCPAIRPFLSRWIWEALPHLACIYEVWASRCSISSTSWWDHW